MVSLIIWFAQDTDFWRLSKGFTEHKDSCPLTARSAWSAAHSAALGRA
jgi:hypothetical protein